MATTFDFQTLNKKIASIDSKILENNDSTPTTLFSTNRNLEILTFLQPNSLSGYIKPLSSKGSQLVVIRAIKTEPKTIYYDLFNTYYGELLIATTDLGVCFVSFISDESLNELQKLFPDSKLARSITISHQIAVDLLENKPTESLLLHLKGTAFQLQVWEGLLKIPKGQLSTYKHIAVSIVKPNASRAIGAAVGKNPIALLIPCHRVIRSNGRWQGFRWGNHRKASLLAYELM